MIRMPQADRDAIDEAIETALDRLSTRAATMSPRMSALADAVRAAAAGGKRFRPALVVTAYRACGGTDPAAAGVYPIAAAFELLHTAFVIHDDVIDRDTERRGVPNVAGAFGARAAAAGAEGDGAERYGAAAAILAGDLLLHEAIRTVAVAPVADAARGQLLRLMDDALLVSAAGELADVENAVLPAGADHDSILAATHDKTAVYSFSAPLVAGAVLAGAPHAVQAALHTAGTRTGMAFQLVDDLIGAFGTTEQAGREEGADLREAKRTALVSLARDSAASDIDVVLAEAWTGPVAVRRAQRMLDATGARSRMVAFVEHTLGQARAAAADEALPVSATDLLAQLCDAIQERIP